MENDYIKMIKLKQEIMNSNSLKDWQESCKLVQEDWQYYEPLNLSFKDRFELDEEAYKEHFHDAYNPLRNYKQHLFIKRLINNITKSETNNLTWLGYKDYLQDLLKEDTLTPYQNDKRKKEKPIPATHLKGLFKDETHYHTIIDILIEENYIETQTLIWKDESKAKKTFIAGLIKVLYNKGYLVRRAKNAEIPTISFNTFKVELSESIAGKTKVNDSDQNYKFIPIVTELQ